MKCSQNPASGMRDCSLADAEINHLNQRLHYLIQVIQQLTVARDLNAIMTAVRTAARRLTDADGATFVLRERNNCYYADEDAISPLWKGGRFPMQACISGWVMLNQQAVVIEDVYTDSRIPIDAYRPTFVKSMIMVPIRTRDPLGAIGNYWATHHTPTAEEINLLQTLADAAAVALENIFLYEAQEQRIQERTAELQRALDFEALLKRITDNVRDSLDERKILATVVQELAQGLAASCCNTTLYNLDQGTVTVCYEYEHGQLKGTGNRTETIAASPELYRHLLQGETVQFCCLSQAWVRSGIEASSLILVCPIIDDQSVLGDIRLYRGALETFTELEVRLVQQVANQCAIALRQARLHESVQRQVEELARLHQLKDDFLSTVSHELRTPITSIKMAAQMLQVALGVMHLDPQALPHQDVLLKQASFSKVIRYLQILSQECQRETNLINDLLDLNSMEAVSLSDQVQDVVLQEWVPQIVEPFRARTRQQHQQLQIQIADQVPPLKTNPAILDRILTELLQNACKYTPAGERIAVSVIPCETPTALSALAPTPTCSTVALMVSNSGVEISLRDRPHIFDKFYRIPNDDPWRHGGTGLGLAVVKRLVEKISGQIEVSSYDNLVCFTVKLRTSI